MKNRKYQTEVKCTFVWSSLALELNPHSNESIYQIRDSLAEILQDYGCGEEYRMANATANEYQNLLTLLEDVHASAVVHTPSQFEDGYHRGRFAYQLR